MRIELRDGQWAELRERITHAQDKEIKRAIQRGGNDPETTAGDSDTVALRMFIRGWSVNDPDGNAISLTEADAIERMPADLADEVIGHIIPLYIRTTDPNALTPPSSDDSSSQARP
jgi:hypothetical protein